MSSYFPENNVPKSDDSIERSLQKINALLVAGDTLEKDLTTLTALSTITTDDLFYVLDDPAGSKNPRKATLQTLFNAVETIWKADSKKLLFGTGSDASINYDGTHAIYNSREAGTGDHRFVGGNLIVETTKVGVGVTAPSVKLHVGNNGSVSSALGTSDLLMISDLNTAPGLNVVSSGSSASNRGVLKGTRARGTLSSPSAPSNNDYVMSFLGAIYDGSSVLGTAAIDFYVDGAVSTGVAPQRISFVTSETGVGGRTERLAIKSNGDIYIPADSKKLIFGAGQDASIFYNGSHLIINSREAGSGFTIFTGGNVRVQDPTLPEFSVVETTSNRRVRLRVDAAAEQNLIESAWVSGGGWPLVFSFGGTPYGRFDVNGDFIFQDGVLTADNAVRSSRIVKLRAQYDSDPTATVAIANQDAELQHVMESTTPESRLAIRVGGSERVTVKENGNVGINKTAPKSTIHATGSTILGAPTAANADGDLAASELNIWVDEASDNLTFKVKYSGGAIKSGTVALT